jgi:serine phosphatase RsbU (regulator of sigma subunit)
MYHQSRANYFNDIGKFADALKESDQAIAHGDSVDYRTAYGTSFLIKANILLNMKDCGKGLQNYERGIAFVKDDDDLHHLATAYIGKSNAYACAGDYKAALRYFQRSNEMIDSLNTDDYTTKIATLNALNNLDKKDKELQLSIKEKESAEAKSKQQSQFLIAAVIIGILILVLLAFSIRAFLVKKKDNELLNSQKKEIEIKNETLNEQKIEIISQFHVIEEKQKEILDSIHYAKRIQGAMLANHEIINTNLPENFILFKPKDIVSGDFYWVTEKDDCFYLAVCDSTGHGVPGAFMSLLNISFLNEAVVEKNIAEPHEILNHVRNKLIENISQDGAKDGMDGILFCFNRKTNQVTYAAANNKPLLVSTDHIIEYPADKMPIGKGENLVPFTLHTLNFVKGDRLYLYSDGYADQFGGPSGKKFKYKALQAELLKVSNLPLSEQKVRMNEIFESWRGHLEQVDDVLLVGLKL